MAKYVILLRFYVSLFQKHKKQKTKKKYKIKKNLTKYLCHGISNHG